MRTKQAGIVTGVGKGKSSTDRTGVGKGKGKMPVAATANDPTSGSALHHYNMMKNQAQPSTAVRFGQGKGKGHKPPPQSIVRTGKGKQVASIRKKNGLSKLPCRRIAKRAGVQRVGSSALECISDGFEKKLKPIVFRAFEYAFHARMVTMLPTHLEYALRGLGKQVYGINMQSWEKEGMGRFDIK
jgi:histone H3/H4